MNTEAHILQLLFFYSNLSRPLTLLELRRLLIDRLESVSLLEIIECVDALVAKKRVYEQRGFYGIVSDASIARWRIRQDVCTDEKWREFLASRRLFRFTPFVEFACAAGSMAMGNAGKLSDFDVIVGARQGRIFTTRFFCIALFGALRKRRKKLSHHDSASNKICLNHFVTPAAYCLRPPHNMYWAQLYKNLVPLYGSAEALAEFFRANAWAGAIFPNDRRHYENSSRWKRLGEWMLVGAAGDAIERWLRAYQQQRITKSLADGPRGPDAQSELGYMPRIIHDDSELEFHPDTHRIDQMVKNL